MFTASNKSPSGGAATQQISSGRFASPDLSLKKKDKYIHIACLLAGLLLPLIAVIAPVIDTAVKFEASNGTSLADSGFGFGRAFLFNSCFGISRTALYSLCIPICFIAPTLFILVCFYIHKVAMCVVNLK